MTRAEKVAFIDGLHTTLGQTPHAVLCTFHKLTVNQVNDLRGRIRGAGGSYRVIPNRLARRAAVGTPAEPLAGRLAGPCAIALHPSDPVILAKTLSGFAKENPQIELLAALVDAREVTDAAGVQTLAALPGLNELRAQLLALIQTPATTLVRLLGTPGTQLARVLDARKGRLEGDEEPGTGG